MRRMRVGPLCEFWVEGKAKHSGMLSQPSPFMVIRAKTRLVRRAAPEMSCPKAITRSSLASFDKIGSGQSEDVSLFVSLYSRKTT